MVEVIKVLACLPGLTRVHPIIIGALPHVLVEEKSENPTTLAE
jgi:hypothetical protein